MATYKPFSVMYDSFEKTFDKSETMRKNKQKPKDTVFLAGKTERWKDESKRSKS